MARIPFDRYRALDAVNWSSLKWMRESPLAYRYHLSAPNDDTPSRLLGRAVHTLVLEPQRFDEEYAVFEGERRAGPEWKAFQAANADRSIVKAGELDEHRAMAAAVRAHPLAAPYFDGALFEDSIRWNDETTGLLCKARLDWYIPGTRTLCDFKTGPIDERVFKSLAIRMGYDCQLSHYRAGLRANGHEVDTIAIVVAEPKPPYDVAVFMPDDVLMDRADAEVKALLARVKACTDSGVWPGRYDAPVVLGLPDWILNDTDITTDEAA